MPLTNVKVGDVYQTRSRETIVRVIATDRKDPDGYTLVGAFRPKVGGLREYVKTWLSDGQATLKHSPDGDDLIPLDEVVHTLWYKDAKLGWRTWGMVYETKTPDVEKELAIMKQLCRLSAGSVQMHVHKQIGEQQQ
jgi:hypothetical protein